jgi:DNA polymerase III subunit epsilon
MKDESSFFILIFIQRLVLSLVLATELLDHYRQLAQQPLTVVDVETTGKYASDSRIIEISVLRATLAHGIEHQQTDLVNPQTPVPDRISEFTGIAQSMVDRADLSAEVLPNYFSWLNHGVLTAHNLEFDYSFLQAECARLNLALERPGDQQLCTVHLSRLMLPDLPSRSLPNLVQHFEFNVGRSHRAEADTLACWLLAEHLLTQILNEPDEVILARFGRQWLPLKYAAKLLGCSPSAARSRLSDAGVTPRSQGRGNNLTYQRHDVERVLATQPGDKQLSWF